MKVKTKLCLKAEAMTAVHFILQGQFVSLGKLQGS